MSAGPYIGFGIRRILDAQLNYVRNSLPVFLRIRRFAQPVSATLAGQLGFAISPTGASTGTLDLQVLPPPAVRMLSMHNIGMSGGKLLMGAREFMISQTFVESNAQLLGTTPDINFWTNTLVVGLVTEGKLFSIDDIGHEEAGNVTIVWTLRGNGTVLK